jgi:hypothetical protein
MESSIILFSSLGSSIGIYYTKKNFDKYGDLDLEINYKYKILKCLITILFNILYKIYAIDSNDY